MNYNDEYNNEDSNEQLNNIEDSELREKVEKVAVVVDKAVLIYKRIVLGIIIIVLGIFIIFSTGIAIQTVRARNYVEAIATFVEKDKDTEFNLLKYTYEDKKGNQHEANIMGVRDSDEDIQDKIVVYYDPNHPDEYYYDASLMDTGELTIYIVEIIVEGLLIMLFFNKHLLNKINLSIGR